jgi:hypothetical protein
MLFPSRSFFIKQAGNPSLAGSGLKPEPAENGIVLAVDDKIQLLTS